MNDDSAQRNEEKPLAEGRTNPRRGSVVEAFLAPEPLLFYRPETGDLLVVPIDKATAFENECRLLDQIIYVLQTAKEEHLVAQGALLTAERAAGAPQRTYPQDPDVLQQARECLRLAELALVQAQQTVETEFKPLGKLDGSSGKLYELVPIRKRREPQTAARTVPQREGHAWAKKWTYVRSDKVKSHFRSYQLNQDEQAKYQSNRKTSFVAEDGKIDTAKLREQINKLEISAAWKQEVGAQGVFFRDLNQAIHASLNSWAEGTNSDHQHVQLGVEAQLLRYFAGAGVEASWNPKKGNLAVRGDARAEFAVAEGKFKATAYWPGQAGHMIQMTGPKSGTVYDAGLLRAGLELELFGLAGASACAQLGLELDYASQRKDKAGIRGRASKQPISSKALNLSSSVRNGAEVGAAGDLFAGARAGGHVQGMIEWNSPEAEKFEALCKIGPGGQVQAGVGISGQFKIDYVGGKFRILASGAVCLGVGAGGKLEFEVDAGQTLEFTRYLAYMLFAVNYELAEIIAKQAFDAWAAYSLWAIQQGKEFVEAVEVFGGDVREVLAELVRQMEKESERVTLMNRVLANPRALEYAPPETKGMIVYQLTRHSVMTKTLFLPANQGVVPPTIEFLDRRKQAVLTVMKKARSKAEFRNILQHMTPDGSKDPKGWQANNEHVQRFLDMGIDFKDMDRQLLDFESNLSALYQRLYDEPLLGYAFVDNDAPVYLARATRGRHHDGFMVAGGYDPGSPVPTIADDPTTRYA